MTALAGHPVQRGELARKGCNTSSAWFVSMLVYIETASQEKKDTFEGSKLVFFNRLSRCSELLM
jgi:hypothetical protein